MLSLLFWLSGVGSAQEVQVPALVTARGWGHEVAVRDVIAPGEDLVVEAPREPWALGKLEVEGPGFSTDRALISASVLPATAGSARWQLHLPEALRPGTYRASGHAFFVQFEVAEHGGPEAELSWACWTRGLRGHIAFDVGDPPYAHEPLVCAAVRSRPGAAVSWVLQTGFDAGFERTGVEVGTAAHDVSEHHVGGGWYRVAAIVDRRWSPWTEGVQLSAESSWEWHHRRLKMVLGTGGPIAIGAIPVLWSIWAPPFAPPRRRRTLKERRAGRLLGSVFDADPPSDP